jgi:hypothetical protein
VSWTEKEGLTELNKSLQEASTQDALRAKDAVKRVQQLEATGAVLSGELAELRSLSTLIIIIIKII